MLLTHDNSCSDVFTSEEVSIEKQKHDDIILESKKLNDERLAKTINPTLMKPLFGKQDIIM